MKQLLTVFTVEELEELEAYRELSEGMRIDGEELICFRVITDVINGTIDVYELPASLIDKVRSQLVVVRDILKDVDWFDSEILEMIENKAQVIFQIRNSAN